MIRARMKKLLSVRSATEAGVYFAHIEALGADGISSVHDFCSRPDDAFGLGPDVRAAIETWIAEGKPVLPAT